MMVRLASAVLAWTVGGAAQTAHYPGVDYLGMSLDLLQSTRDGVIGGPPVFGFTYNQSIDLEGATVYYPYSVGLSAPLAQCSEDTFTDVSTTTDEYIQKTTKEISVKASGSLFGVKASGAYSHTTTSVYDSFKSKNLTNSIVRTKCILNTATLFAGLAGFDPRFQALLMSLPAKYTPAAQSLYYSFFETYPPHVLTGCKLGGVLKQLQFTKATYTSTHTQTDVETQASVSFLVSVDSSYKSNTTRDHAFTESTDFSAVQSSGGQLSSDNQWSTWAKSVEQYVTPQCLDWVAADLATIMRPPYMTDPEINARAPAMQAALTDYFTRPGCTSPTAVNYNASALQDDGSCVQPTPSPPRPPPCTTSKAACPQQCPPPAADCGPIGSQPCRIFDCSACCSGKCGVLGSSWTWSCM